MNNENGEVIEIVIRSLRLFHNESEVPDEVIEFFAINTISSIEIYCNRRIETRPMLIDAVLIPIVKRLVGAWLEANKTEADWRDVSSISEEGSSVSFRKRADASQILLSDSALILEEYKPLMRQNRRLM